MNTPTDKVLITTAFGLEELLIAEIKSIAPNCECNQKPGQVLLSGTLEEIYGICLWSRLANRVLLQLNAGEAETGDEIYRLAKEINWPEHFSTSETFAVDFFGTNDNIRNTQFGALKIKDAIVDTFSQSHSVRPNVDKSNPNLRLQGRLHRDNAAIYLDMSGSSLHQRHYRQETGPAPIRENLAFAMLARSGWTKNVDMPLCDPMCGSGTIAIEAALFKSHTAPGLLRKAWGFSFWKKHQEKQWQAIKSAAKKRINPDVTGIYANDISGRLVSTARENAQMANVLDMITFSKGDASKYKINSKDPGYLVCNPPYGERLSEFNQLLPVFQAWGSALKASFQGWSLAILTSNRELLKQLKLASHKAYKFKNSNLDCELLLYKMNERNCKELKHEAKLDSDFANRLRKNWQKTQRWLKNQNTDCFRIYDADLPEYNVAIDKYADCLVIQEYAPPKDIPEHKARARVQEVVLTAPKVLDISPDKIALKVREVQKGKSQYEKVSRSNEFIEVQENGAKFWVNLHDYLDTGLFLDHRDTRQKIQQMSRQKRVLNLFAYTGSVSVFAALGGAKQVTTVDMSNTYLDWAKRNFQLNKINGEHEFIKADVTTWLEVRSKSTDAQKYDLIFIDPPSFSNSKSMENTWDVQRDHGQLISDARQCLADNGIIVFSNNLRSFKLDTWLAEDLQLKIENISTATIPEDFKRNSKIHHCFILQDVSA